MSLSKRRELFRLALVHRCVHGQAPAYLAECYETNKQYGHCITWGVNKLHFKVSEHRVWQESYHV